MAHAVATPGLCPDTVCPLLCFISYNRRTEAFTQSRPYAGLPPLGELGAMPDM